MKISKLLELATARYDDFCQIYEAVNDVNTWEKIKLEASEKDKLRKAMELLDAQTYELMVTPLRSLKAKIPSRFKTYHENLKNCDFENNSSALCVHLSNKKTKSTAWFELYYE